MASDGSRYHQIKTGSVKRVDFEKFVLDMPFPHGTVLILDNCTIHKKLEAAYMSKGYVPMFLPAYAPQFQPVELAFSKVKGHFRQLWPWNNDIVQSIETSLETLRPNDNIAFFKHANRCLATRVLEIGDAGCA
jgi:transposase